MTIAKEQVATALAELRMGRSRANGDRAIRSILRQFGGGASSINELAVARYAAVYAAVAIPTPADHYGTVTDVQPITTIRNDTPPARTRVLTPLIADLERKLAERAGKPRSRPTGRVSLKARMKALRPSQPEFSSIRLIGDGAIVIRKVRNGLIYSRSASRMGPLAKRTMSFP